MTKSFQIFDGKIRSLKQHLQLIDLSLTLACKCCNKEKDNGKNIATTLHAVSELIYNSIYQIKQPT